MTNLAMGQNTAISAGTDNINIKARHVGPECDLSVFVCNENRKVPSDDWMVFFNQPASPDGSVTYAGTQVNGTEFIHNVSINLKAVPADIQYIQIALTIDGTARATFADEKDISLEVLSGQQQLVRIDCVGESEYDAIVLAEIYRRNGEWKVRHFGQGYAEGLVGLCKDFGVAVDDAPATPAAPTPTPATPPPAPKVELTKAEKVTKQLEESNSPLVSLQKAAAVSLKKNKLDNVTARVVVVIDASGSARWMWWQIYQQVLDRLATLALNLDDNQELELWIYATQSRKTAVVTLENLPEFLKRVLLGGDGSEPFEKKYGKGHRWDVVPGLGGSNNEPEVMAKIIAECGSDKNMPTLVLFITDGGINEGRAIKRLLIQSSSMPIFWQFIGLGGNSYGVLQKFDTLEGRVVDNAGFFSLDRYDQVSDEELFHLMLKEFPQWMQAARVVGILTA